MSVLAVGTAVTIKNTIFSATVTGGIIDNDGVYQIKASWTDEHGVVQERYFLEDQLVV
jgi:uncharacterized protein YodC (DUF2158 family)